MLGVKTAISAIALLEGIDKLGPPYLMKIDKAAESRTTLMINPVLLFMEYRSDNKSVKSRLTVPTRIILTLARLTQRKLTNNN
ncbi:hypothetical protein BCD67_07905 [Oscillatoriales cyanobacterium USR001]|nr:hypothetical protein BCD67_07905 [Oscillatoriales cyanobacterium USR001]